jgi:hypothetical protein
MMSESIGNKVTKIISFGKEINDFYLKNGRITWFHQQIKE